MASASESSPRKIGGDSCFGEVEIGKIGSTIKSARLEELRQEFHIPASFYLRIPLKDEQINSVRTGEICVFEDYLKAGLRFPIHSFIEEVFGAFGILPCRLTPNAFRHLIGFLVVCHEKKIQPSLNLFRAAFSVNSVFGDKWFLYFMPRNGCKLLSHMPPNIKHWKDKYFFVSSDSDWGFPTQWTTQFNKTINCVLPLSDEEEVAFEVLAHCVLDARKIFAEKYLRQAGINFSLSSSSSDGRKLEKLVQARQTQRKRGFEAVTKVNLAAAKRKGRKKAAGFKEAFASDGFSEVIHVAPDSPFDTELETKEPVLEAAEVLVSSPLSILEIKGEHEAARSPGIEPRAEPESRPSSEETSCRVDAPPIVSVNRDGTSTRSMASDGLDSLAFIPFTGVLDTDTIWVDRTGGAVARKLVQSMILPSDRKEASSMSPTASIELMCKGIVQAALGAYNTSEMMMRVLNDSKELSKDSSHCKEEIVKLRSKYLDTKQHLGEASSQIESWKKKFFDLSGEVQELKDEVKKQRAELLASDTARRKLESDLSSVQIVHEVKLKEERERALAEFKSSAEFKEMVKFAVKRASDN